MTSERDDSRLVEHLYGELSAEESRDFAAALRDDPALADEARELADVLALAREADPPLDPPSFLDAKILAAARQAADAQVEARGARGWRRWLSAPFIGGAVAATAATLLVVVNLNLLERPAHETAAPMALGAAARREEPRAAAVAPPPPAGAAAEAKAELDALERRAEAPREDVFGADLGKNARADARLGKGDVATGAGRAAPSAGEGAVGGALGGLGGRGSASAGPAQTRELAAPRDKAKDTADELAEAPRRTRARAQESAEVAAEETAAAEPERRPVTVAVPSVDDVAADADRPAKAPASAARQAPAPAAPAAAAPAPAAEPAAPAPPRGVTASVEGKKAAEPAPDEARADAAMVLARAEARVSQNDLDAAERVLLDGRARHLARPTGAWISLRLARLMSDRRRFDEARRYAREALSWTPEPAVRDQASALLRTLGNP